MQIAYVSETRNHHRAENLLGQRGHVLLEMDGTFEVGQRERLTVRLKSLIRQYPLGPGVIKEFIQNADDARSPWVRVVMDWRDHHTGGPGEEMLSDILGPALLIINGSEFSDGNFEAIQKIGESDKLHSTEKTGRFGLGFNTAYNITDYPSFVSRDRMLCFDPHEDAVARKGHSGVGWKLGALAARVPAWHRAFAAGGLEANSEVHAGTIFRLPLRTSDRTVRSEISQESFDESKFREIVDLLIADGPAMMLFTRHVMNLTVEEIPRSGGAARTLLDIRTENPEEVARSRASVNPSPDTSLAALLAELVDGQVRRSGHRHAMTVTRNGATTRSDWQVQIGLYVDPAGALISHAGTMAKFGERAIPEVGVAVSLRKGADGKLVPTHSEGMFCCGLPLSSKSGLPVHLNGCFDLDDSRTRPTKPGSTSDGEKVRAEWNQLLLRLAVPRCYGDALEAVAAMAHPAEGAGFYALWPVVISAADVLQQPITAIQAELARRPIFRCMTKDGAVLLPLAEVHVGPPDASTTLVEALLAQGLRLPNPPIPEPLLSAAAAAKVSFDRVTAAWLRRSIKVDSCPPCLLEDAPSPGLRRREWLEAVAKYVLRDEKADYRGLPLALLSDGKLTAFGLAGTIFLADDAQRSIFRDHPQWFLDPAYAEVTGVIPKAEANFRQMTPDMVIGRLQQLFPTIDKGGNVPWDPDGEKIPNSDWLTTLLDYLSANAAHLSADQLRPFPLVPDQAGMLHAPGYEATPLLRPTPARLERALEALPLPLVSGGPKLMAAVRRFAESYKESVVWTVGNGDLIETLSSWAHAWEPRHERFDPNVIAPILDILAENSTLAALNEPRVEALQGMRLFPTTSGAMARVEDEHFYLPAGEKPPAISGSVSVADVGPHDRWRPLLAALCLKPLNVSNLIIDVLLPAFPIADPDQQRETLQYLRANLDRVLEQEATAGGGRAITMALGTAKLLRGKDGELHAAASLFSPDVPSVHDILGPSAIQIDLGYYPEPQRGWLRFFGAIGLKEGISAADLLRRVEEIATLRAGTDERRHADVVLGYLQKQWEDLKGVRVSLADGRSILLPDALKGIAWLPAAEAASYPGFSPPEKRFFKPTELFPYVRGHLVAGEAPLLGRSNLTGEMLTALGIRAQPDLDLVLRRFERLIGLAAGEPSDTSGRGDLGTSFKEVYSFLGRTQEAKKRELRVRFGERACVWDSTRRRLFRPSDVFAEAVPFFEPIKIRINPETQVAAGLDVLGRRDTAGPEDFRDFLEQLKEEKGDQPCNDTERRQALHALRELGSSQDSSLTDDDLPILTETGHLVPLADVVRRDNVAWADRIEPDVLEFAHPQVTAPSIVTRLPRLSHVVEEVLEGVPIPSADQALQQNCRRLEELLRSPQFSRGLIRLVSDARGYYDPNFRPNLNDVGVRPAISISTALLHKNDGRRVGGGEADLFVDSSAGRIWIATKKVRSLIHKVAKAIGHLLGDQKINDYAALEHMLAAGPGDIEAILDDRDIGPFPPEEAVSYEWDDAFANEPDVSEAEEDIPPEQLSHPDRDPGPDSEPGEAQPDATSVMPTLPVQPRPARNSGSSGAVTLGRPSPAQPGTGAGRPSGSAGQSDTEEKPPVSDRTPPPRPGIGRLDGWSPGSSTGARGGAAPAQASLESRGGDHQAADPTGTPALRGNRDRFVTYVAPRSIDDQLTPKGTGTGAGDATPEEMEVARAAVAFVLAHEREQGRSPREMPHSNPGYDVESGDGQGLLRYIEVKGIDGPWDEAGVRLSAAQFRFAMAQGIDSWLYVVEHARDNTRRRIHRIQDPANKANTFCFDRGWVGVAAGSPAALVLPAVGEEVELAVGGTGTVISVETDSTSRSFG